MFVLNHDIALEDLGQGISRKVLAHSDNMMSVEVHFETGAIGAMHSHPHEQLTYVLSGEFEFTIGDEKKMVKTGDTMYKEPNIEHGCVCLKAGVLIDTFTPMRKDFV
ncbi:TPA: cupin domain-containing protein [Vibrio vulnificus]|uniref:cupin domain-containing protein n=1 Tax=Vibrio vulnificus TaxID=672 RepID=UPI0002EE569C|nr:cupin domain-containing protein [Vibrio vulnificus]EGR0236528.1 cupin domain-containing protein [Vibrio vulnificus]EHK9064894.1 cupin domain-containing protein [Vibrio vulnificus]EJT1337504.1 cupin domain-containing protein [Vibrio vulnificus]ELF4905699.1 cupin domain-containing protein [Vibrio vulnificus]ELF6254960.1 cupin domain-containing protein [Vibrio vulnificus]